ncbi:Transmembrane protein 236 [Myotis davidii]|uniref:Transmembrane protein 236 n=1 Tax=Myotis davidii TaxID=225400 RepID=L5LTK0_MYODS|nr:Transmembrane protein 236 [Myotis davidii]
MASGRLIKLLVFELLEFAAFSIPTLVIVEQFATAYQRSRNPGEKTHYWLIVSCSIAYVASVQKNVNGSANNLPDTLPDLPVSLVLTSLIMVDIIEKLRTYPLRGRQKSKYSLKGIFFLSLTCCSLFCHPVIC